MWDMSLLMLNYLEPKEPLFKVTKYLDHLVLLDVIGYLHMHLYLDNQLLLTLIKTLNTYYLTIARLTSW